MAATKKPASKAAVAEKNGDPAIAEYRGLEITLPPSLPTSFGLRLGRLQAAGEDESAGAMYAFLERLLGPEQLDRVMDHMDEVGGEFADEFQTLMEAVSGAYGGDEGESSASPAS